jgi:pseudouridine-5'-phosphate glycosidase
MIGRSGASSEDLGAAGGIAARLRIAPDVAAALAEGRPVVALESTLISHGLAWPENLAVARASEAAVREAGAVPATVAIQRGELLVGLEDAALEALATAAPGRSRRRRARASRPPSSAAAGRRPRSRPR